MKQYRYRGKKNYPSERLYLVGIVALVVLAVMCWSALMGALEHSMIELPAHTSVVEVRA